jgi:hypothetical protein
MSRLADKLAALDEAAEAASERWRVANAAANRAWETGFDALCPLAGYYRDVEARKREADPNEAQRLTRELFERIERDGLLLMPLNPASPASGVRVDDPRPQVELADATTAVNRTRSDRDAFLRQHGADLKAEQNRERMARVRDALGGDDPDALREALT